MSRVSEGYKWAPIETEEFTIKDSGSRQQFDSGMQRDTEEGKVDYTYVLPGPMLDRWAIHLMKGAEKYDRDNWLKGNGPEELERAQRSAARHMVQWLRGDTDEDHAAAVIFNLNSAEYFKDRIGLQMRAPTSEERIDQKIQDMKEASGTISEDSEWDQPQEDFK